MSKAKKIALTLAVGLLLIPAAANAQSPSPRNAPPVDRLELKSLCQQNAIEADDLESCLDVVRRFLVPTTAEPSSGPIANDSVTVKGGGDKSSKAFELAGGDYIVTLTTRDVDRQGFGFGCSASGSLSLTDDNSGAASVEGGADRRHGGKTTSYLYGIPPERFYWDFGGTTCERWEVTLQSIQHDYAPEPELGVVIRKGKDTMDTKPFVLSGGDYTAEVSLKSGANDCQLRGNLIPVSEYNMFSSVGDVSAEALKRKTTKDETQLYAVPADRYYWSVSSYDSGLGAAPCDWSITLRQA